MSRIPLLGLALVALLGLTFVGAGCGAQPGKTTMTYSRTNKTPPPPAHAMQSGEYALYASDGTTPIWSDKLDQGDEYGFMKNDAGKVVGYVMRHGNTQPIPLENWLATSYYWKYKGMPSSK